MLLSALVMVQIVTSLSILGLDRMRDPCLTLFLYSARPFGTCSGVAAFLLASSGRLPQDCLSFQPVLYWASPTRREQLKADHLVDSWSRGPKWARIVLSLLLLGIGLILSPFVLRW